MILALAAVRGSIRESFNPEKCSTKLAVTGELLAKYIKMPF